ncbi:ARABIDOPSIS TRITHORAX-RELATED PROTEIN 6, SET DOMAIN PROTEIN 34 [Hibiscus trionum]|uniref:ARABIDOPSIS TRITHORAX-RELATED PROTEIN 6, SET DOMAIN PROTEIN 34 n=1 Tax=Hibiscus trionum TaxID=183268 RepID=A0A9W7IVB6_HIBTR|nr:ARABIDOPSIS TRITHORAX-RELATED PROTEIN 6, SET DOMAIN PROTEIN 34 [Hibiscus trionum]
MAAVKAREMFLRRRTRAPNSTPIDGLGCDDVRCERCGFGDFGSKLLLCDKCDNLVICPDKRSNIARFVNGINNFSPDGRKKQNLKCVRYDVNGECRVLLIANRDIRKGERLYYDYNEYEHKYPTEHFV